MTTVRIYQGVGDNSPLLGTITLKHKYDRETFNYELDRGYSTGVFSFKCDGDERLIISPNTGPITIVYRDSE